MSFQTTGGEMGIPKSKCLLYKYYKNSIHCNAIDLFVDEIVTEEVCRKAEYYFAFICEKCKKGGVV